MKRNLTFLLIAFLFFTVRSHAQDLVITEIMYNDPSTGGTGDSLEFIEIFNNSTDQIDITGYQLSVSVVFTFPSYTLQPSSYVVVAKNAAITESYYGLTGVFQWAPGQGLANNGLILLSSATGEIIDSVSYASTAPWPLSATGNGSSIMLCDPTVDNSLGSNWVASGLLNANIYGLVAGAPVYATPGAGCISNPAYIPEYASVPYSMGFDSLWINGDGLRNAPDHSWKISPPMGNNSCRRDDDGHAGAGWNTVTGAYTPAGAESTTHSARFHTSGTQTSGSMDLYLNFSANGIKKLRFWYINTSGTDSLAVYLSEDAGITFNFLAKYTTTTTWQQMMLELGSSVSPEVILRFKATGTAVAGGTDIGLDRIDIFMAPANDAGISAITSPASTMSTLNNDVKVTLSNVGGADLTSVTIDWEINGVQQASVPWTGSLSTGSSETNVILGNYTFPATGTSTIRAWTSMPNGMPDGDPSNDTAVKTVYYQPYATIPFEEGFDSIWMNKLDSNDVPGNYWVNQPSTGNASWRRNDDGTTANWTNANTGIYNPTGAGGTSFSARFHSAGATNGSTGTLLLFVDFSPPGYKELRFNYMNTSGNDSLAVWKSEDGSNTFTFLQKFTNGANWAQQVIQLGSNTSPNVVIRFTATRQGGGGLQSDIGLDQVHIGFTQPDAGILSVVAPVTGCGHTSNEAVTVKVKNFGYVPISSIPVNFNHNGNIVQETVDATLQPGDTATFTFIATLDLTAPGSTSVSFYTSYPNDNNPLNDTLVKVIANMDAINTFPFLEDFETGNTTYLALQGAANASVMVDTAIGVNNSKGLRMTGGPVAGTWPGGTGTSTTPAQAWSYSDHLGTAATCLVDATTLSNPLLKINLRQLYITTGGPMYSYFRVLINDTVQVTSESGITNFNPATPVDDPYTLQVFDLSAYGNSQFKITFQSACKYAPGGTYGLGDNVFIDNFIIEEKPGQEVGVLAVTSPSSGCNLGTSEHITVSIQNNGASPAINFPVSIKVDNGNWITETSTLNILPDSIGYYTLNATFDLSASGPHSIEVVSSLSGDPIPANDTLNTSISVVPFISTYPYFQDFEDAFTGWTSGAITGQDIWVLGTPAKANLNYAFSGSHTWVTDLTANYQNNANIYVVSPCYDFTSLVHPYLSVWLNFVTQNNFDAMILEASVNDSAWYKVPTDTLFYNNYSPQLPVAPPKWSGNSNGFAKFGTTLESLAGVDKVRFRFRFQTNATTVNEGFCIDDFEIKEASADAQCLGWLAPTAACSFSNAESVSMRILNTGELPLVDLPVAYSINNGATFVNDTVHTTISPGQILIFTFAQTADLSSGAPFHCIVKTMLPNDPTPGNNSSTYLLNVLPFINGVPFTDDFESSTNYFSMSSGANASVSILPGVGMVGSSGMQFTGLVAGSWPGGSSQTTTPAQAFSYTDHVASASTCDIAVSGVTGLWLKLALRQTHSTGPRYSFFRVMLNDTIQLTDTSGVADYNPATQNSDIYAWNIFDITSYIGNPFRITLQASCKYDDQNATGGFGDKAQVDSVMLLEPVTVGTNNIDRNPYLIAYPNPAVNNLRVDFGKTVTDGALSLFDALGNKVLLQSVNNVQGLTLNLHNLTPGVYCLKLTFDNILLTKRIIKE